MPSYGKAQTMGYTDYYNQTSQGPNTMDNPNITNASADATTPQDVIKRRRAAIQRRLKKQRVSV